jgi:lipoprotein-releasing system permease protein
MNISRLIAQRYLFAKKHVSLLSVLTYISVSGITLGAALLISVLSIFNGFFTVIQGFLLGYDPALRVESIGGPVLEWNDNLERQLQEDPRIVEYTPFVEGMALLRTRTVNGVQPYENKVIQIKGISTDLTSGLNQNNAISSSPDQNSFVEASPEEMNQSVMASDDQRGFLQKLPLKSGLKDLSVQDGRPGILVPEYLRAELQLEVGDEVVLLSARHMQKALTQISIPRTMIFTVRGVYELPYVSSPPPILLDISAAHRLFVTRNRISGVDLSLENLLQADAVKTNLASKEDFFSSAVVLKTWYDLQKPLYDVMYLEKWGAFVVLMIIILVAALNILGSLSMIVLQKKRDIGVLRSLGLTAKQVQAIFIQQGLIIGVIGAFLGAMLGLSFCYLQDTFGLLKLSSAFIIDAYPVDIQWMDVLLIMLGTLGLSVLASWMPARNAAKIHPARVIRYE